MTDLSAQASVTMPLGQWDRLLGLLRTGAGVQFTWEMTNPLIQGIGAQLQQQMYPQTPTHGVKGNGQDHDAAASGTAEDGFRPAGEGFRQGWQGPRELSDRHRGSSA